MNMRIKFWLSSKIKARKTIKPIWNNIQYVDIYDDGGYFVGKLLDGNWCNPINNPYIKDIFKGTYYYLIDQHGDMEAIVNGKRLTVYQNTITLPLGGQYDTNRAWIIRRSIRLHKLLMNMRIKLWLLKTYKRQKQTDVASGYLSLLNPHAIAYMIAVRLLQVKNNLKVMQVKFWLLKMIHQRRNDTDRWTALETPIEDEFCFVH